MNASQETCLVRLYDTFGGEGECARLTILSVCNLQPQPSGLGYFC